VLLRILIADDEPIERKVLKKMVIDSKLPATIVGIASSGDEALQLFDKYLANLVIIDIRMPGMNGLDVSEAIKKKQPDTVIAIITAYDEFQYAKRAIDIHVDFLLLKPVQIEEVLKVLQHSIRKLSNHQEDRVVPSVSPYRSLLAHEIARLLHHHYDEPITLVWLESQLNVSQQYISRTFKEAFQISIMDYLKQYRMQMASQLLANPEQSIAEIAEQVGISDASYFGQIFKHVNGVTPTEYRNQLFVEKQRNN
jgi:two-component system response regulator YesN